jgi:hypothetical protein
MKKKIIRWLQTVKLPSSPRATWTDTTKTPMPADTGFRIFEKGEETSVDVEGDKITIKRLGALPARLIEDKHYQFIDDLD